MVKDRTCVGPVAGLMNVFIKERAGDDQVLLCAAWTDGNEFGAAI